MAYVIMIGIGFAYFLPTVIAVTRGAEHNGGVFVLNLLFGWTIIGWIAAFVWACVSPLPQKRRDAA